MLVPTGTINKVRMNNSSKDVVSTKELFGSGHVQDDRLMHNSISRDCFTRGSLSAEVLQMHPKVMFS